MMESAVPTPRGPDIRAFSAAIWSGSRSIGDPRLSPDASLVSFVATYGHGTELAVMAIGGGPEQWLPVAVRPARAGAGSGGVHGWLPSGTAIAYIGNDNCVYIYDLLNASTQAITTEAAELSALAVSPDGTKVAYVDYLRDVYVVPVDASASRLRLSADADFAFDPAWSTDSKLVAWIEWDVPNMPWDGSRLVVRDCEARHAIITVAGGEDISVQQPRFSPNGQQLGFLNDETGWLNLWSVDTPGFERRQVLVSEKFEHGDPSWSPGQRSYAWSDDGDSVVYCRNEAGFGRLMKVDLATGAQRVDNNYDFHLGIDVRRNTMVALRTGATQGPELQVISETGVATIATTAYLGLGAAGVEPEPVNWYSLDGALIHGRLYRAPTAKERSANTAKRPLLVWLHGGPTSQSSVTLYARWSYFLQRGWSVLVVDYRGTTGWGRQYTQALRNGWGEVDVADATSGIEAAIQNGWGTAGAIVPYGGSAGGLTALLALSSRPDLCAAGVVMYPATDLTSTGNEQWRFEAHYTETLVGSSPETNGAYSARSPVEQAHLIKAPLLVMHGSDDIVVPIDQSKDLVQRMEEAGGTVEFHIYEGEGHGWRKPATRADELVRMEAFLNRYVLGLTPG